MWHSNWNTLEGERAYLRRRTGRDPSRHHQLKGPPWLQKGRPALNHSVRRIAECFAPTDAFARFNVGVDRIQKAQRVIADAGIQAEGCDDDTHFRELGFNFMLCRRYNGRHSGVIGFSHYGSTLPISAMEERLQAPRLPESLMATAELDLGGKDRQRSKIILMIYAALEASGFTLHRYRDDPWMRDLSAVFQTNLVRFSVTTSVRFDDDKDGRIRALLFAHRKISFRLKVELLNMEDKIRPEGHGILQKELRSLLEPLVIGNETFFLREVVGDGVSSYLA